MKQNYLNNKGKLNKKAQDYLLNFENRKYIHLSGLTSSFKNSIIVACSDLFIKITNKEEIKKHGFGCGVKCIMTPNFENPYVIDFFTSLTEQREEQKIKEEEFKKITAEQIEACKQAIDSSEAIQKYIQIKREKGDKDRTIAWKLSSPTRKPNLSNFTIHVIYNSIYKK